MELCRFKKQRGDLLNIKAGVGVCREIDDAAKLVVVPKDPEEFEDNELVLIISVKDFKKFSREINGIINFMESIKELEDEK